MGDLHHNAGPAALTDESPMPYGKHAGTPMQDVPADYLLWLLDSALSNHGVPGSPSSRVMAYIRANKEALEQEAAEALDEWERDDG